MRQRQTIGHLRVLCVALAASAALSADARAHEPVMADARSGMSAGEAETAAPSSAAIVPANLLAAVCGMPGHADDANFQRRVEVARLMLARAETATSTHSVPLFEDLGEHSYPITTSSPEAQRYFDQGLRLLHGFNHPEALRAFREAQRLDTNCAMCFWGEAYALGPNINAPMDPAAVAPAVAAIEAAMARRESASERERALIEALATRYSDDPSAERAALDRAYADAMAAVAARVPDDVEILALYADALMNRSPWDYWEADGQTLKPEVADLVPSLEKALALNPRHPFAIHLYIHAVEASTTPERAEPYADRLAALMPGAGHIVHMPAHIYFRIGRFADSIATNREAVAADEAYLARVSPDGLYPYSYYPHNVHFLLESARMAGDGATALAAADKLPRVMSDDVAAEIPWVQLIKAAPYFVHAQFSPPATTLALEKPGDRFPYVQAMWHYARGVAHATQGDTEAAKAEAAAIAAIAAETDFRSMIDSGVPVPDLLQIARLVVIGRIAQEMDDRDAAIDAFRQAAAIQDRLPYLEPPFWYYPVEQSLGAALLQAGRAAEAEAAFRKALGAYPGNAWALYGLREAARQQGDDKGAQEIDRKLQGAWLGTGEDLDLSRL